MLRLIIAEDEDLLREGLVSCIPWSEIGYQIVGEAADGRAAKRLIKETNPDVLITDIKMPHIDGITLCEELREERPDLKMIILSGYDEFEYARRAIKAGVCEYVLKPVKIEQLNETLRKVYTEIEQERERRQEFGKLQRIQEHSAPSIRSSIFGDLLLNKRKMEDIQLEMLQEEEQERYYAVGIVERQDFPMIAIDCDYLEIMEIDRQFGILTDSLVQGIEQVDVLRSGNCERLLCVNAELAHAVKQEIEEIQNRFQNKRKQEESIELSFGHVYKGIEGLVNSMFHARKIKEVRYMQNWDEVLRMQQKEDVNIKYLNYNAQNLLFEIRSGTPVTVGAEIDKFEHELAKEKINSHMHTILIISNLFYEVIKLPEEVGGDVKVILGNPAEAYHRIIGKQRRREMVEEFMAVCLKLNAYFASQQGGKLQGVVKRITDYIEEQFTSETLSMKDAAEHAYISVSYLSIILKKETGKTFIEYLTDVRMDQARKYLTETGLKNYEVAEACGYSNPTYFSTVFKGICGMSPSSYRKEFQNIKRNVSDI